MTKTDFAELKEKLTKLDDVAANEYLTRYMEGFYDEPTYKEYGDYIHDKSAAIIRELIEIIKNQSEVLEYYTDDLNFDTTDDSGVEDVEIIITEVNSQHEPEDFGLKAKASLSETTTRLQKLINRGE